MAQTQRQYDFQPGTKAISQQVDDELNGLVDAHNALDADVQSHKTNTSNPHVTTAAQVGALSVDDARVHGPFTLGSKLVDESQIADSKVLMYESSSGNIVYKSVPGLSGGTVVADGTVQTNLNADMVDGKHVGYGSGQIPYLDNNAYLPVNIIPSTTKATASDIQITSTAATTVAQFIPTAQGNFEAKIYYRVVTGTTNVTVQVTYDDGTGSQTNTVLNAQSTAVGSYSCLPVFLNAKTTNPIKVIITASVANQVFVSASIVGY